MTTDASTLASPCNDVCTMDAATGWCVGCRRTMDEIGAWGALDDESKRRVLAALPTRGVASDGVAGVAIADSEEAP